MHRTLADKGRACDLRLYGCDVIATALLVYVADPPPWRTNVGTILEFALVSRSPCSSGSAR